METLKKIEDLLREQGATAGEIATELLRLEKTSEEGKLYYLKQLEEV